MTSSLVGSEMCIRDSSHTPCAVPSAPQTGDPLAAHVAKNLPLPFLFVACLLYTSDAADDM
eukprot:10085196-Prorocentrum_lima.AAC.1